MKYKSIILVTGYVLAVVAVHLTMHAMEKEFCLTQLTMSIYYALVVLSLCLVMGYAGQVSLGHGAFFAIGGYTAAVLTTHDWSSFRQSIVAKALARIHVLIIKPDLYGSDTLVATPWAAFFAAMLITVVVAALIGYPALRLKGHYLAMATLGFGLIVNKFLLGTQLTGAADGITGVPEWHLLGPLTVSGKSAARVSNYYIASALALLAIVLLSNLVRSRVGRALQAIHDRETAANAMGIDTAAYKLRAFVLSAVLAAAAGVFCTHYTGGIGPSEASALKSVRYVALAAAGGMTNLWGALGVSTAMNYFSLRGWFGSYDTAVFGAILIIIISIAPDGPLKPIGAGMAWLWARLLQRIRGQHGVA